MDAILEWFQGWYNWPFLFTLAVGVIFILFDLFLGGLSDLIGLDGVGDADADPGVDGDMNLGIDADGELDGPDPDLVAAKGGHLFLSGLAWLGLGKVPISVLLEVILISFGVTGLLVNAVWSDLMPWLPGLSFPAALLASCIVAPFITKVTGGFIARIVPADATTSTKAGGFVGEVGITATSVSASTGQVRVERPDRPLTLLNAKTAPTVHEVIPRGTEVLLSKYDASGNIYLVVPTSTLEL